MTLFPAALSLLAALSAPVALVGAGPAILRPDDLLLGDSSGTPLIYFAPVADATLVLAETTYGGFGEVIGYTLDLGSAVPPGLTVRLRRMPEANGKPGKFVAAAGDHTLADLSEEKLKNERVALNPTGPGGVVLAAPGELKLNITTEFAYDGFGRRQIAAQTFIHAGARWKVEYSDYTRDRFGRLTGYRAKLTRLPDGAP